MSTAALYKALIEAKVPEDLALQAVENLPKPDLDLSTFATKSDLSDLKSELKSDLANLEVCLIKWMIGITIASIVAIFSLLKLVIG